MLTGAARIVQEAKDKAQATLDQQTTARRRRELEQEQAVARAQLEAMQLKTAALQEEMKTLGSEEEARRVAAARDQEELTRVRGGGGE